MKDQEPASSIPGQADIWRKVVLENALDAVIGIDQTDRVINWNRQAELTFGWTAKEALGRRMAEVIIPPEFREGHQRGMEHSQARTG